MATAAAINRENPLDELLEAEDHFDPDSLPDIPKGNSKFNESNRRTKIKTGVDISDLSGSDGSKPFAAEMEQLLMKNQEALSKRASKEASGKGSILEMVVPRTVFLFKKLRPKKLIVWSNKPLHFPLSQVNEINTKAALRSFECIPFYA